MNFIHVFQMMSVCVQETVCCQFETIQFFGVNFNFLFFNNRAHGLVIYGVYIAQLHSINR